MVTQKRIRFQAHSKNEEFIGLSSDIKPIENVENGDSFFEMDTNKEFCFDASSQTWVECPQGGGSTEGLLKADGSVPLTGALQMDSNPIVGASSISGPADTGIAIESNLDMNNHKITKVASPDGDEDVANKKYVDSTVVELKENLSINRIEGTLKPSDWNSGAKQVVLDESIVPEMYLIKQEDVQLIFVGPQSSSYTAWKDSQIAGISQMEGTVVLECSTVPTVDINFYIAVMPMPMIIAPPQG